MADGTKIEWTDATWNVVNGCSVTSPGCTNCYAMKLAGTRLKHVGSRAGLTREVNGRPVWTGETRFNEAVLLDPLRWKRPRKIFVCAHGDLFHESVPDEWIDRVFAVMALAPQHVFQVLTKRPERMREYLAGSQVDARIDCEISCIIDDRVDPLDRRSDDLRATAQCVDYEEGVPLPNVWLGVSVEDQKRADERIPHLLATPAAVRFLSCEPLLGRVDIRPWIPTCYECGATCGLRLPEMPDVERCTECGEEYGHDTEPVISEGCPNCCGELEPVCPDCGHYMVYQHPDTPNIDWVIVGGESGPGARPMKEEWVISLRDQCRAYGVAFFMKQMTKKAPIPEHLMIRETPLAT
jgi:protein gp37